METTFTIWQTGRGLFKNFLDNYSLEQLNTIPDGLTTNLIWNVGHIIVSQQKLVYALSGLPMHISDSFFEKYQNGSRPDGKTTQAEVDEIKSLLFNMVEKRNLILKQVFSKSFIRTKPKQVFIWEL